MNSSKMKKSNSIVNPMELQESCAKRPQSSDVIHSIPCCHKLHKNFCFKVFVFLLLLVLNIFDLASDWLLYRDCAATEEGLVYGPVEDYLKYLLLSFSIVGSVTFTFEITNLWWEIFRNNPWIDIDLLSAITIWIEDVPQIIINVLIVACREEAVSYFQLVKASVIIVGAIIRIIITMVSYCSKQARHDLQCVKVNPDSKRHVIYRVVIMFGLLITLGGAITVFMFTQSERNPNGTLNFKIPHSIIEGEFDDYKYFHNVSIYFSHKVLQWNATSTENINFLRLFKTNEIRKENFNRAIRIQMNDFNKPTRLAIWSANSNGTFTISECIDIDRTNLQVRIALPCNGSFMKPNSIFEISFKFHYTKSSVPKLIFGDIKYNAMVKRSDNCTLPDFTIVDDFTSNEAATLHYYHTSNNVEDAFHVIHKNTTLGRFYHTNDLTDIKEVWKTGFVYCKCSGSLGPHKDATIDMACP